MTFRLNIPNCLTLLRIVGSVFFLGFLIKGNWSFSLLIFSLAALTDMIDGTVARLLHQRTRLGGFLDPAADKFLMFCGFFVLTWKGIIPLWATAVVVSRDAMISAGIFYFMGKKLSFPFRPTYLSKAATLLQILTLFFYLLDLYQNRSSNLFYLTLVTVMVTALTGIQYVRIGIRMLHGAQA